MGGFNKNSTKSKYPRSLHSEGSRRMTNRLMITVRDYQGEEDLPSLVRSGDGVLSRHGLYPVVLKLVSQ